MHEDPPRNIQEQVKGLTLDTISTPEEFLSLVDFTLLNNLLDKIEEKSGKTAFRKALRPEDIAIDATPVETSEHEPTQGSTHVLSGKVSLSWNGILQVAQANNVSIGASALHALIHEAVHSRSRNEVSRLSAQDIARGVDGANSVRIISGLEQIDYDQDKKTGAAYARNLNEAVTEEIALAVFKQYLPSNGETKLLESSRALSGSYANERVILNVVIDELTRHLDVADRDLVWRGFVQAYMNGSELPGQILSRVSSILISTPDMAFLALELGGNDLDVGVDEMRSKIGPSEDSTADPEKIQKASEQFYVAVKRLVESLDTNDVVNALHL